MVTPLSVCGVARLVALGGAGAAISGLLVVTNFLEPSALLDELAFAAEAEAGLRGAAGCGAAALGGSLAGPDLPAGAFAATALPATALAGAAFATALAGLAATVLLAAVFATALPDLPAEAGPADFFAGVAAFDGGFAAAFCGARCTAFATGFPRAGGVAVFARLAVFGLLFAIPKPIL